MKIQFKVHGMSVEQQAYLAGSPEVQKADLRALSSSDRNGPVDPVTSGYLSLTFAPGTASPFVLGQQVEIEIVGIEVAPAVAEAEVARTAEGIV